MGETEHGDFHYTVKIVGRSKGKSIISASAYLNGDVMKMKKQAGSATILQKRSRLYQPADV